MNPIDEPIFDAEFKRSGKQQVQQADLTDPIRRLLEGQSFCVLCTQGQEQPYGSLIAFAFSEDLKHLYFTTPTATRKFRLLTSCRRVALVVDSRCQHQTDMKQVEAVTITAKATHIESGTDPEQGRQLLLKRHPYLGDFLASESTALFRADVVRYFYVTRFQEVTQWIP